MEIMEQQEYIEQLESMICSLASAYMACKHQYHDKHLEVASQRDITDQEWNEINRFPDIQGANGLWLSRFAQNTKFKNKPIKAKYIFDRIKKNVEEESPLIKKEPTITVMCRAGDYAKEAGGDWIKVLKVEGEDVYLDYGDKLNCLHFSDIIAWKRI